MKQTKSMLMAAVIFLGAGAVWAEAPRTVGRITKVTVYQGQALVTRTVELAVPEGASELVVEGLPPKIVPESLHGQAAGPGKVLSVRYRETAVREDTRAEVRVLDQEIEQGQLALKKLQAQLAQVQEQWKMYEKLKEFTVTAAQSDLNRGLLAAAPVKELTAYIEEKGQEHLARELALEDQIRERTKEKELLERKREHLVTGANRTLREALVFVSGMGGQAALELSYLVNDANWNQQYNLRARPEQEQVLIEYNAVINQTSGEDWNKVELRLSTADPTMVAAAPVLEPMEIGLSAGMQNAQVAVQQMAKAPVQQLREQQQVRRENIKKGYGANVFLNELALSNQTLFLQASGSQLERFQEELQEITRTEGVSATYGFAEPLSIPSRSDQQLVTIASIESAARFTFLATPLLTDYVYLQADLVNESETVLLPGPATIYRKGEFVGRGEVPLVTIGERFTAGFGIDSQVRVNHQLEKKTTRVQGGNRIDTYHYAITLNNYKNTAVPLRLLDRLPHAEDASVRIELAEVNPGLSADAEYNRTLRKEGILRWDLTLEPNTVEEQGTVVRYTSTMEYDRNMQIEAKPKR